MIVRRKVRILLATELAIPGQVRQLAPIFRAGARKIARRSLGEGGPPTTEFAERSDTNHTCSPEMTFTYVYILESKLHPEEIYVGITENLKRRLHDHNAARVPHTSKFAPWKIRTATAFTSKERATAFERYLKSGSGRAFLHRHL